MADSIFWSLSIKIYHIWLFYKTNHITSSSLQLIHTLLERLAAHSVQNGSLDCFSSLKNHVEDVSLKLETNVLENLFDLSLGTGNVEVLLTYT